MGRTSFITPAGLIGLATALLVGACQPAPQSARAPTSAPTSTNAVAPTAAPTAAASTSLTSFAMARTSGPASGLLFIAADQGFLKANGLDVDIRNYPSSADAVSALVAGDIVGAQPSASTLDGLLDRGVAVKAIGIISRNPHDEKTVGSVDITGPADLKGKKVGVVGGTSSEFQMGRYLAQGGLTMNDVEVIKADPPELVAAMGRGDIQAFDIWEPFPTNAMQLMGSKVHVLADSDALGVTGALYQIMSAKFLSDHPQAGVGLMKAYIQAEAFLQANPQKAIEIIAAASQLDVASTTPVVQKADYHVVTDPKMLSEMQLLGAWLKDLGRIKAEPDYAAAIDVSYLKQADPSRVTYAP
jgi:ABC-type nitrate/sulfonate/bicarbonate transport system substrate-binding protein